MRKLIAAILILVAIGFAALAYSCYSQFRMATNLAHYYSTYPNEMPLSYSREDRQNYISRELKSAETNRNLALLSAGGSLLLGASGIALLLRKRRATRATPFVDDVSKGPGGLDGITNWANQALARPVTVSYTSLHNILFVFIGIFFVGMTLLMIAVNGFTGTSVLLLSLNGGLLPVLYYLWRRARQKAACVFDIAGVTRGDKRRLNWDGLRSVDYLMVIREGGRRETLWRIDLVFSTGEAWLIPRRIRNFDEITNIVSSIPAPHQKRLA